MFQFYQQCGDGGVPYPFLYCIAKFLTCPPQRPCNVQKAACVNVLCNSWHPPFIVSNNHTLRRSSSLLWSNRKGVYSLSKTSRIDIIPYYRFNCSIIINPRRACAPRGTVVGSVCVSVCVHPTSFIHPTNDTTYLTGNEGQNICVVFSENAPLQS